MTFSDSVATCFSKFVTFSGRASRSEFWWFMAFVFVSSLFFDALLPSVLSEPLAHLSEAVGGIWALAMLLPGLAVASRRLHDIGMSAWWLLLYLVPVIGWIILIINYVRPTRPEGDRFGPPEEGAGGPRVL